MHIPLRILLRILAGIVGVGTWVYAYTYYQKHTADIWLQVDTITQTITLPFKIAKLYQQPPATQLPIPVFGIEASEITDTWGAARSEGRTHEGVDIFASRGTPVFSVGDGYVIRVGDNPLGGLYVMTVGPGGVRYYYAHLDGIAQKIGVGMPVTSDTVLGFVGNTGNASGTPPHLHFGMYTEGPQNPYTLLVNR